MSLIKRLKKGVAKSVMSGVLAAAALTAFASPAHAWWEADYAYRTTINLNAQAAGINGEEARAPELVRPHTGNLCFQDVKGGGSALPIVAGADRPWPMIEHESVGAMSYQHD